MNLVVEIFGVFGAVLLLTSYWLVSSNQMPSNARESHFMNFVGATLIVFNSGYHGAWIPAALNIVWALRGFYGLILVARS